MNQRVKNLGAESNTEINILHSESSKLRARFR